MMALPNNRRRRWRSRSCSTSRLVFTTGERLRWFCRPSAPAKVCSNNCWVSETFTPGLHMGFSLSDMIQKKAIHILLQVYIQPSNIDWICETMSVGALGLQLGCQIRSSSIILQVQYPISIWTLMQLVIEMCCDLVISDCPNLLMLGWKIKCCWFECQFCSL